ncbi:MAG: HD domain-containing protein [Spirochaetaceae bacterium]|nr:MAG: HD domain-containing protein [Spirochaetaceae bacterium]
MDESRGREGEVKESGVSESSVSPDLLDRLERLVELKDVPRTGWVLRGIRDPESVADHSWGTAQLCLLLAPPGIDRNRAIMIALVHDLAEVETGDIPRRVAPGAQTLSEAEKHRREEAAMRNLTAAVEHAGVGASSTPGPYPTERLEEIRSLWEEYLLGETGEAQFARDMNLIDMCLQAVVYQRGARYEPGAGAENFPDYPALDEFFATCRERFLTTAGRDLYRALWSRYRTLRDEDKGIAHRG